jgi:hypothetical protein
MAVRRHGGVKLRGESTEIGHAFPSEVRRFIARGRERSPNPTR